MLGRADPGHRPTGQGRRESHITTRGAHRSSEEDATCMKGARGETLVRRARAELVQGCRRLLFVLWLCISAARCFTPSDGAASSPRYDRTPGMRIGESQPDISHMVDCLTRVRILTGGAGIRLPLLAGGSNSTAVFMPSSHRYVSSVGCVGKGIEERVVYLSAGGGIGLTPSTELQWQVEGEDGHLGREVWERVLLEKGSAGSHRRTLKHMRGTAPPEGESTFTMTQSGTYQLLVRPRQPDSFSVFGHKMQLRVVVSSGFPSARTSRACYFKPPTSNDTHVRYDADEECEPVPYLPNGMVAFETTPGHSEYLKTVLVADAELMNISNASITDLLVDRELPLCLTRKCLSLQVRRYDSWSNPVLSSEYTSEISISMEGVPSSMYEVVERGRRTIVSDGELKKWETYQWIGGGSGENVLGNNSCSQFACNVSKLVGPETNVVSWVVIRMDGVPLGFGSPFKVEVVGGGFYTFMVDPFYMHGFVESAGGAMIRLIPVDKAGNPVKNALSDDDNCDPNSRCAAVYDAVAKAGFAMSSECYVNGALSKKEYELDADKSIGKFAPHTPCASSDCPALVEFWYCNRQYDRDCGPDGTKPTATGGYGEKSSRADAPEECNTCPFNNGEALIATVKTTVAASCLFNITWNGTQVINPIQSSNSVGTHFFGTKLGPGQSVLSISAGEPNPEFASIRYPGSNASVSEFAGAINPQGAFELIVTLQDSFGNPSGGSAGIVGELRHPDMVLDIEKPKFNVSTGGFHVIGRVTVSGRYRMQLMMLPFRIPLGGSPFLVDIQAGMPIIPNTLLLRFQDQVTIDSFGYFYFQARDEYNNYVPASHAFFKTTGSKAPGFWVWLVPRGILDDNGLPVETILDTTGYTILSCGGDPDPCDGDDPGDEAFIVGFRLEHIGRYHVELQYCDPRTHVGGQGCNEDLTAWNHSAMTPPEAPNPCKPHPAGKGGARLGLACTLQGTFFTLDVIPDRIVVAQTSIQIADGQSLPVGKPYSVQVSPNDRRGRPSATASTTCVYHLEYYEVYRNGKCRFRDATRDLIFDIQPNVTGTYRLTVYIDHFLLLQHPVTFFVTTSVENYDSSKSTATGTGIEHASAGVNSTIFLFLRDFYGNVIPPQYEVPLLGYPYWRECGYNYDTRPDGSRTSGYGNPGSWRLSLSHGCRIGLHVYVMDWNGLPIRPARGFEVLEIRPQPEGSIKIVYTVQEAGVHSLYFRYLNTEDGGNTLHNATHGYLSLQAMNRSREGQIHGSPFLIKVVAGVPRVERTRTIGPGIIGGSIDSPDWTRFDVAIFDSFNNQAPCIAGSIDATVTNPTKQVLATTVGDADGSPYDDECHVFFRTDQVGTHQIDVKFRDVPVPGGPFFPKLFRGTKGVADVKSRARLIAWNTKFPCYNDLSQISSERCSATSQSGSAFAVRVSARDPQGLLPSDEGTTFQIRITEEKTGMVFIFQTHRLFQGEHELETTMTSAGKYHISVSMNAKLIQFSPWSSSSVPLVVAPARTDALSSLIRGKGLSIATAGISSSFSIIPRDVFGNQQHPSPSPDLNRESPGAGIFQVRISGPSNTIAFARVAERADGSFLATFTVGSAGQHFLFVTLLDEVPTEYISAAAVAKKGYFRSALEDEVPVAPGRQVSKSAQPVILQAEPNVPSSGRPCTQACCKMASRFNNLDLGSSPAVAGEPFKVSLELYDICGNPTRGQAEDARMLVYGPLTTEAMLRFQGNASRPGITPMMLRTNKMDQEHKWQESILLTASGVYGIAVSLSGMLVHQGATTVQVLPVEFTLTENCVLDRDLVAEPLSSAGFDFYIEARDPYGNSRSSSSERFELDLSPVQGQYEGSFEIKSDVRYVSGGTYYAQMSHLGTFGKHVFSVRHEGRHIHGSPFMINLIGGKIDADNADASFFRVTSSSSELIKARVLNLGIDDDLKIVLQGRDSNGALTRGGLESISFVVEHETKGNITPSFEQQNQSRTQTICTLTNYGDYCVEPPRGSTPIFSYEVQVDGNNSAHFTFKHHQRSKCRSMTGFDDDVTLYANTKIVKVEYVVEVVGGDFMNETVNQSMTRIEYHPTMYLNASQCQAKCARFNCTCATSIENTGTYRDGTCIAIGGHYFLETFAEDQFPANFSVALVTHKLKYQGWEFQKFESPLTFIAKSRVSGKIKLFVRIAGQDIRTSPISIVYSPGLLSMNQTTIAVRDQDFNTICLGSAAANCIIPAAGENYVLSVTPRDSEGNELQGTLPASQFRIKIEYGASKFEGLSKRESDFASVFSFSSTVSGDFKMSVQQETTYGTILKPFSSAASQFPLRSSARTLPGKTIVFDKASCTAECQVGAIVPNDAYNNSFDASYILLVEDVSLPITHIENAFVQSAVFSGLVPISAAADSTTFMLTYTRSGSYVIVASSIHGQEIPGSPITLFVEPSPTLASITVSGPGSSEVTIYEGTYFLVDFSDPYGNAVLCDTVTHNIGATLFKPDEIHGPVTILPNSTSGNSIMKSCRMMYSVTAAGVYALEVKYGGSSEAASNVTTALPPGSPPSKDASTARCYLITNLLSWKRALPCLTTRTKSSIGDEVRVVIAERTDGGGLVGSKATLIAIEGDNATQPEKINAPNYTQPAYHWTIEMEMCDQLIFLVSEGKSCQPVGELLTYNFSATDTNGDIKWNATLEKTGIWKVIYRLPRSDIFNVNFGYLTTPWFLDVQAKETDLSKVQIFGTGLDIAIYNEEGTFVLEDRDQFGNLRAGTELVSDEFIQNFRFDFSISVVSEGTSVNVKIKPDARCLGNQCFLTGKYNIGYNVKLPSTCSFRTYLTCPDALTPAAANVTVLYKQDEVLSKSIEIKVGLINYSPATALVQAFEGQAIGQTPTLLAGVEYTLLVKPQDLYGNPQLVSREELKVQVEKGQPEFVIGTRDNNSTFAIRFKTTVGGTYRMSVLDGEAHVRGSPFEINVLAGAPNPQSCVIQGPAAFIARVGDTSTLTANLVDSFGNIVTRSQEALVTAFFSTASENTSLLQIPGTREGAHETLTFTITRPGEYRMQVKVGTAVVGQGQVITGGVEKHLGIEGTLVTVLPRGTCASQCKAFGQGLTVTTAGITANFFIVAKDEFGVMHRQQGEYFGVTVNGRLDDRCAVSTELGYPGMCSFTASGSYSIVITFAGNIIGDRHGLTMKVEPAETYPLASYLQQVNPKVNRQMIDGVVYSSTTDLEDGFFLGNIGKNVFTLVINDKFGNRLRHPKKTNKVKATIPVGMVESTYEFNSSVQSNSSVHANSSFSKAHGLVNTRVEEVISYADHDVKMWVKKLSVSYTGGFLMWEEGTEAAITNATAAPVQVEDGLDEFGNPIQPVILNTTEEVSPEENIPDQPEFNKTVIKNLDGTISLAFDTTAAGKYRLQVYVDGFLIRRYIPLIEIEQEQAGMIKSKPDCCIPWDDLRKIPKEDGVCPGAASPGPVCGDLMTLLPGEIDVAKSFVIGNETKEFKPLDNGDQEGNKGNPVFQVSTVDFFGNVISAANYEMLITIVDINGTVVLLEPMTSIQPKAPQYLCRQVPPDSKCGRFEYRWTGLSASRSGKYLIDISFNGQSIGMNQMTSQIRSVEASNREAQIWGPGLQVAVVNEMTYFYFRVKDKLGNDFEPDSIDSKKVSVDFGTTCSYYGVCTEAQVNSGEDIPLLELDSKTLDSRTKLIYFGYGLFQVQYNPLPASADNIGSVSSIKHDKVLLVIPTPQISITPRILEAGATYDTSIYKTPASILLVPDALTSFATGSGLYNHFAGDEMEVTVHAMSNYRDSQAGYWPATHDAEGNYFSITIDGPPGVVPRHLRPIRGSGATAWQFQSRWVSTIPGAYTISITYGGTHVQGDSSSVETPLPQSPYQVQVIQAPVQPRYSVLSGAGLLSAKVGVVSTFMVSLRDIFNNSVTSSTFYQYKAEEHVNASLIASKGPAFHTRTISLRDGRYRLEYMLTRSGEYSMAIMVNGILLTNPPLKVHTTVSPDHRFTRWLIQRAGLESEMCKFSNSVSLVDIDGVYLNPGCMLGLLSAGDIFEILVELRDSANSTIDAPVSLQEVNLKVAVTGSTFVEKSALPVGSSFFSTIISLTKAGTYSVSVSMGESVLPGSPFALDVVAAILYIPACFTTGDGLQSAALNRTRGLVIHGSDIYGNNQTLQHATIDFTVDHTSEEIAKTITSIQLGMLAHLTYRIEFPGDYRISVRILDADNMFQAVPGSGIVVTAFKLPAPRIISTYFSDLGDSIHIEFESQTDQACMHGSQHGNCLANSRAAYEDCCFLFQNTTCESLGKIDPNRQPKCVWQSPYVLTVNFGLGATILPRDRLHLNAVIRNQYGTSEFVQGSLHIDPALTALYPTVSPVYFPKASTCQSVWIDASQSRGSGGRPLGFEWSVGPQVQPLHSELKNKSSTADKILFSHDRLDAGTTEVTISARNFLGYSASEVVDIVNTVEAPIRVMINEGTTVQTYRTMPLTLSGQVEASPCIEISDLDLSWSQVVSQAEGDASVIDFGDLTLTNKVLSLPSFLLSVDTSYTLTFQAKGVIAGVKHTAEAQITIHVLPSALHASIAGPYGHVAMDALLVWDASTSFDPDLQDSPQTFESHTIMFQWSCNPVISMDKTFKFNAAKVSSEVCFYDIGGIFLQKHPVLNLTGHLPETPFMCQECLPGVYQISVNVTRSILGFVRWSVASSVVSLVGSSKIDLVAGVVPVPFRKASPSRRIFLESFQLPNSNHLPASLEYEWSVFNLEGCCLGHLNMSFDLKRIFPNGNSRQYLVIKPNTLSQGLGYVFQLTIKDPNKNESSSALIQIDVDTGPRGGEFMVYPPTGTALDTDFSLLCADWTDDAEDYPFEFDFEYAYDGAEYARPIESTKIPKVEISFPDIAETATELSIVVSIRDVHGTTHREEKSVMLNPSPIISLDQVTTSIDDALGEGLARDINSTDFPQTMQRINNVISTLNKVSLAQSSDAAYIRRDGDINITDDRRRVDSKFSPVRSQILKTLKLITNKTTHTRHTVRALSVAMHLNTLYPNQIAVPDFHHILVVCQSLMLQKELFVDNINAGVPFAGILRNLLQASRQNALRDATRFNLRNDELLVGQVMMIKNVLSQAILQDKLPDEEFVFLQTSAFLINCRRVRSETARGLIMGSYSLLESQGGKTLAGSSAYSISADAIDFENLRYKIDDNSFFFGTKSYPGTVYDTKEAFPKSSFPSSYRGLEKRLFQAAAPMTQRDFLTIFYLDFEITQWRFPPFETGEMQRSEVDWASIRFGRVASFTCSSVFTDCSGTDNMCVSQSLEGSSAITYRDTACNNAFDSDERTSWAVNPEKVSLLKQNGAGSQVSVTFVEPFTMAMIKYTPRPGPKFCAGSQGLPCQSDNFENGFNCSCVIGGDRLLSFTFSDGSQQVIELAQSYDSQTFDLKPVLTSSVTMTVMSVYSDSSKCPGKQQCAWWQPTCADWCPNGATSIEFLSTKPIESVYDYNYSYMSNYTLSAALVSDVTSLEVRQYDHVMRLFALDSPFQLNMTVQSKRRSATLTNDQNLVVCRSWDGSTGRWSSRGSMVDSIQVEDPFMVPADRDGLTSCIIFFVANFSLVMVEKPFETISVQAGDYANPLYLAENSPDSLVCALGLFWLFCCYCFLVVVRFRGWLKVWHHEQVGSRSRRNEYLISMSNPSLRGRLNENDDAPIIQPFYYPIIALAHSQVIAAHAVSKRLVWRIHFWGSFRKWHYLYAMVTGQDEISRLARITSLFCLVMLSFAINACTISGATINGKHSLIQTEDSVPSRWWQEAIKAVLVLFPMAQVLPAIFRMISMRHDDFDRWEVSDVVLAKQQANAKEIFAMDGVEKRSDLKTLKRRIGSTAVFDLLNPIVQEDTNMPQKAVRQSLALKRPEEFVKIPQEKAAGVFPGSIKHYVQTVSDMDGKEKESLPQNDVSLSSLSVSIDSKTQSTGTVSSTGSSRNTVNTTTDKMTRIRGRATLTSVEDRPPSGNTKFHTTLGHSRTALDKDVDDDKLPDVIELDETDPNWKPPPPTPRNEDPAPVAPLGVPARFLTKHQEKSLLRKRRMKQLQQESVYFASSMRQSVFKSFAGDGYRHWNRGERPLELLFFPSHFIKIAYAICLFWLAACYLTCFVYTTGFDRPMAWSWAYASMSSLAFECLVSQTLLALTCAWWKHIDGRVAFSKAIIKWCVYRSDLMPAMG